MPKTKDEVIQELTALILMQEREVKKLKRRIKQLKQYIVVYEEYIRGERDDYEY